MTATGDVHDDDLRRATLAVGTAENHLGSAADQVEAFIREGTRGVTQTRLGFPTLHLVARSIADLRAGMFLVGSGFVIQMCSVIRPVPEAMNLIELFAADEERAEAWLAGKREFSAATVRNLLGKGPDAVYDWLAERSHPRIAGAESATYTAAKTGEVILIMGGLPLNDPQVLIAATMPGDLLGSVAHAAGHIAVNPKAALQWPTLVRTVDEKLLDGTRAVFEYLHPDGVPRDSLGAEVLQVMEGNIDSARKLEAAVAGREEELAALLRGRGPVEPATVAESD
jgi:hypothetical protein